MKDSDLPDFGPEEECEKPEWLNQGSAGTETIDAQQLWPDSATDSGSFVLTEARTSSFGKLLNALPTPALVVDRSAAISFANAACCELTGNAETLRGCPFSECMRPQNPSQIEALIKEVFEDRKTRVVETLLKTQARNIWGRVHLRSVRFGKEQGLLVIVEDLTAEKTQLMQEKLHREEMKQAQELLEKRVEERTAELLLKNVQLKEEIAQRVRVEQRLVKEMEFSGTALDSLPGIFYFCDDRGRLLRWNKNLENALGYSAQEISSMQVLDFFSDNDRGAVRKGIRRILLKGEYSGETKITCKDGRVIPYLLNGVRITVSGRPCFLGMGIDISQRKQTEKALQESEIRYQALFDESRDGIFITKPDRTLVNANRSFLDIFGFEDRELIGTDFSATCDSRMDCLRFFEEIELHGSVKDYPLRLKRKDSSPMECTVTASLRHSSDGTVIGYHGILRDVTTQVEAEKRIKEQNSFLNSLLESLTHPFYVIDASNHEILHANSAARRLFAAQQATCYGASLQLSEPCATQDYTCPVQEVCRTGRSATVEHVRSDEFGNVRYVEIHAYPVTAEDGSVSKVIKYNIDVTGRKQTEQALRDSEERMRLVIEASPIGMGIVQEGSYIYANPALAETFGYDYPTDIVGLQSRDLFPHLGSDFAIPQIGKRVSRSTSSEALETEAMRRNGEFFDASVWVTAINFQGKPSLLEFVIDMSTEKALRARLVQAQKMEAIGTLAGGIAHDFNNLLTVIQGFAELVLLEQKEGDRCHADLEQVIRAARNGADLVRSILTFSRNVEPQLTAVDLNHEVKQAEKLLRRTIPKMIEIELNLEEPLAEINGDPSQIEQILLNLAVNAQHAMPEGGRLLIETKNMVLNERHCRGQVDMKPGPHVMLSVTDNGQGMPEDVVDHVFEPFFTTKKPGEGTGLGLAMVFGIVKSHGGTIICRSNPGVGTAFEMCFPATAMQGEADDDTEELSPASGNETILLVDDEEPIRDLGTRMLTRAGYQVITAAEGPEALDIYRGKQDEISLILLDVIMPVMSGVQCLEKLVEINPRVKVLVTSGYAIDGSARRVVERASKGFVSKPFQIAEVLTVIRDILDETGS